MNEHMYWQTIGPGGEVQYVHRKPWARERHITVVEGESMTQQDPGMDTDINHIVARFDRTGIMPPASREPQWGDITQLQGEYLELCERAKEINGKIEAGKAELAERAKATEAKTEPEKPVDQPATKTEPEGS